MRRDNRLDDADILLSGDADLTDMKQIGDIAE